MKSFILDTPEEIKQYRLLSMYHALKLETQGLKFRGGSVYARIKKEFGLKGNKATVLQQFGALIGKHN